MKSTSSNSYNECGDEELLKRRRWEDERMRLIFSGVEDHQTGGATASAGAATPLVMPLLSITPTPMATFAANSMRNFVVIPDYKLGSTGLVVDHDDLMVVNSTAKMIPPPPAVTVVLEGRSICQRISLHKHANYQSLASALRQMFLVDETVDPAVAAHDPPHLHLTNAIPGHLIAYEDMENDLLLVGDLNWKDFVRVAKRIRILPIKTKSSKGKVATRA